MTNPNRPPNPFHLLGLPVDASNEQIVERAEELVQMARDNEERDLYVWAKGELITHPRTRGRHEGTEPRHTDYERGWRWEDFVRQYRRAPIKPEALINGAADQPLEPTDFDLTAALRTVAHWVADSDAKTFSPLFETMPGRAVDGVPAVEVRDVLFG